MNLSVSFLPDYRQTRGEKEIRENDILILTNFKTLKGWVSIEWCVLLCPDRMLERKVYSIPSQLRESFWHSRSIDMQKVLLPEVEGWKAQGFPRSDMTNKKTKEDWICNCIEFVSSGILPLQEERPSSSVATDTIHKSNDTDVLIKVKMIRRVMAHQLSREQTKKWHILLLLLFRITYLQNCTRMDLVDKTT